MFEGFSDMQNVISRMHTHTDFDQESEYYRLEFGCERFKHFSGTEVDDHRIRVKEEPFFRLKWWKH